MSEARIDQCVPRDSLQNPGLVQHPALAGPIDMAEEEALLGRPTLESGHVGQTEAPGRWKLTQTAWRLTQGIILLVAVAIIWVAAGQLAQSIFDQVSCPFFLTYLNVSEFIVLLPLQRLRERYSLAGCGGRTLLKKAPVSDWRAAFRAALWVCPMWFLAQGSYNWSLQGTSVSSSTVLSTTSCVFTFVLSLLFLGERFRWSKAAGVAVTIVGAVLVALADRSPSAQEGNKWWGDALAIASAVFYGLYTTAIRRLVPDGSPISMNAFFGWLGLTNSLLLAPVVGLLAGLGIEKPSELTPKLVGLILAKGLFDNVLSDLLWARAIQLTSPTVATVALSLTIPIAMLSDWVLRGKVPAPLLIGGSVAVAAGFVLSTVSMDATPAPTTATAAASSAATATAAALDSGAGADGPAIGDGAIAAAVDGAGSDGSEADVSVSRDVSKQSGRGQRKPGTAGRSKDAKATAMAAGALELSVDVSAAAANVR